MCVHVKELCNRCEQFPQKEVIFNRTEEEREARAEREKETAKRTKGREHLRDREEARWEGISSAKMFPGKHIQRAVIRGMALSRERG